MRVYSVRMNKVAVTGAITLVQLKAGSSSICRILRAWCSQFNQTSSVMQDILILRKSAAATVTSFTPVLVDPGDAAANAAGGTSATGTNASAEGTDGDTTLLKQLTGWNTELPIEQTLKDLLNYWIIKISDKC